jgi:Skp1 family, tetramerisation domain
MSEAKQEVRAEESGDDSRTVHLVSGEGESFDVPLSVAKMSELVKTMIADEQDDDEVQEIPLPNVKSSILAKVIEFAQHYKKEPMTDIEKVRDISSVQREFYQPRIFCSSPLFSNDLTTIFSFAISP